MEVTLARRHSEPVNRLRLETPSKVHPRNLEMPICCQDWLRRTGLICLEMTRSLRRESAVSKRAELVNDTRPES